MDEHHGLVEAGGRLSLLPALPGDSSGRFARRALGVGFAILPGLGALLQQPLGGFLDAPSPIYRQQAECDRSSARRRADHE